MHSNIQMYVHRAVIHLPVYNQVFPVAQISFDIIIRKFSYKVYLYTHLYTRYTQIIVQITGNKLKEGQAQTVIINKLILKDAAICDHNT